MTGHYASAAAAVALVAVHVLAGRLDFLDRMPRSRWLSAAGGVSVAYVFVHLLPELGRRREELARGGVGEGLIVYACALAGLVLYYALEHAVRKRRESSGKSAESDDDSVRADGIFWLHIASFALYNAVIGHMLTSNPESLFWFSIGLALHFVVTDHGLSHHHHAAYDRIGRWVVSAGILAGWGVGVAFELPHTVTTIAIAILAGAIVLNVMKEELPKERESRMVPFVGGAAAYAALLLAI